MAGEDSSSGTGTDPWRGRGRGRGGEDKLGGAAHPGAEWGARLGRASWVLTLAERVTRLVGPDPRREGLRIQWSQCPLPGQVGSFLGHAMGHIWGRDQSHLVTQEPRPRAELAGVGLVPVLCLTRARAASWMEGGLVDTQAESGQGPLDAASLCPYRQGLSPLPARTGQGTPRNSYPAGRALASICLSPASSLPGLGQVLARWPEASGAACRGHCSPWAS